MSAIVISAVILTDGGVLLRPSASSGMRGGVLPRYVFGEHEDSIEDSLAGHLLRDLGIEVEEQSFIETVYERAEPSGEVVVNNLQLVTAWRPPEAHPRFRALRHTGFEALERAGLAQDVLDVLLPAFGLSTSELAANMGPGPIILLVGESEPAELADAVRDRLGGGALIRVSALRAQISLQGDEVACGSTIDALLALNALTLARNSSAAGLPAVVTAERLLSRALALQLGVLEGLPVHVLSVLHGGTPVGHDRSAIQIGDLTGLDLDLGGLLLDLRGLELGDEASAVLDALGEARIG